MAPCHVIVGLRFAQSYIPDFHLYLINTNPPNLELIIYSVPQPILLDISPKYVIIAKTNKEQEQYDTTI